MSRKAVAGTTLAFGIAGAGISLLLTPIYTAKASFLAPQQSQSASSAALAALGGLGGLGGIGLKTPSDQFVSLLESARISDRMIDRFKLLDHYGVKLKQDAQLALDKRVKFTPSKKDSFIFVEVEDESPERAAAMANAFVEELQGITSELALTEAAQRRAFFERLLVQTKEQLIKAQTALEASGFSAGVISTDPKASADLYAKAKSEATAAQLQLDALLRSLTEAAPEILRQRALVAGLNAQVRQLERPANKNANAAYVSAYRNYKHQETLYEVYTKQFEAAKLDEAREAPMIQIVDAAKPPEKRSRPKRFSMVLLFAAFGLVFASLAILLRHSLALPAGQRAIP